VVDYKQHDPVHAHLISAYASRPFDVIFDTAGSDEIWDHCASYLKKDGIFVSIVGGAYQGIVPVVRNQLWPTILGGVPRKFRLIGLFPNGKMQQDAVDLVNEGAIKEVPIDSEWAMEEVVQAFEKLMTHRAKGKIVVKVAA
jgi:NADPH:quinone reductase-like Zn-dependent oxidoreductase